MIFLGKQTSMWLSFTAPFIFIYILGKIGNDFPVTIIKEATCSNLEKLMFSYKLLNMC